MGKPGSGYWCAPFGLQRAGPREGARYGYRGVIVGEASHPGPVPTPADLSGAASSGEVLRYMRPTAGGGIGPSRGGGHRQGKGGRASGSGRRGRSSVGARADPPTPTTPPGGDIDGAGEPSTRPEGATPRDLGTGPPLVYAPLGGVGPPAVDVADDRADDPLARPQVTGLVTRGLPGPRMNRCLLLDLGIRLARRVPSLALATLSDVVARAMSPCRRLIPVLPPQSLGGCSHGGLRWGRGHPRARARRDPP